MVEAHLEMSTNTEKKKTKSPGQTSGKGRLQRGGEAPPRIGGQDSTGGGGGASACTRVYVCNELVS